MNNKKYEFTGETKTVNGKILKQIRLLKNLRYYKAGHIGGWIEKESNLSHDYDCWIGKEACVYENASVSGMVMVLGCAEIYGCAGLFGTVTVDSNAKIFGTAILFGSSHISTNAEIYQTNHWMTATNIGNANDEFTVYRTRNDILYITTPYFIGTVDAFLSSSKKRNNKYIHKQYKMIIKIIRKRILHSLTKGVSES